MIGNKTCVLSKCGALDKNLGINLQHFTVDMWNMMDASEQPEPEFKARMVEGMEMCYKFSQSIPQDILAAKGPMYEMFGRQMKFFMCKKVKDLKLGKFSGLTCAWFSDGDEGMLRQTRIEEMDWIPLRRNGTRQAEGTWTSNWPLRCRPRQVGNHGQNGGAFQEICLRIHFRHVIFLKHKRLSLLPNSLMNQCFQNLTGEFGNKELPIRHFPQKIQKSSL